AEDGSSDEMRARFVEGFEKRLRIGQSAERGNRIERRTFRQPCADLDIGEENRFAWKPRNKSIEASASGASYHQHVRSLQRLHGLTKPSLRKHRIASEWIEAIQQH